MRYFERVIVSVIEKFKWIAIVGIVAIMVVAVANIIGRQVWRPIFGTYEIVELTGGIVAAFAISYCGIKKGHVVVGLLIERFPPRIQAILGSITGIMSLVLFGLVTWQVTVVATGRMQAGQLTLNLLIPYFPFLYGIALGCAMLGLVIMVDLLESLAKAGGK